MIDVKIGEEHKTTQINQANQETNYTEKNTLVQIQYLRDKISRYEEVRHKQRYYTNLMLTLIFIVLFVNTLPTIFTIITLLYNAIL